jgi:hypothetical protein
LGGLTALKSSVGRGRRKVATALAHPPQRASVFDPEAGAKIAEQHPLEAGLVAAQSHFEVRFDIRVSWRRPI